LMRPRGVGGLRRVFVGRETELDLLRATYRRVVSQQEPHLVTIVGEPGIGKTRLVRELWEVLAREDPSPIRRTGRCLPYGDGITYWPLGEVLKEHFGILDSDTPERAMTRLSGHEILGLALGLDVAGGLHPLDARERLHAAAVGFLEELARKRPAVNLVEDIHWAEDDLLELLNRVVRDARAPIVLLATARPELFDRRPEWGSGRRNATTIWLEPLPSEATSQMLSELLAGEPPDELRALVVAKAEGTRFSSRSSCVLSSRRGRSNVGTAVGRSETSRKGSLFRIRSMLSSPPGWIGLPRSRRRRCRPRRSSVGRSGKDRWDSWSRERGRTSTC